MNSFYIKFRPSFFILILLMIALNYLEQFFIAYFFMAVHEMLHIAIAKEYGAGVKGVTFMPTGLRADIQGLENISLLKRTAVIGAPPLFNIIFGILFINSFTGIANIFIGIFNLLPVYPLDGSRLLLYIGGYIWGTLRANRLVVNISLVFCISFIFMGFLQMVLLDYNPSLLLAAVYIIRESRKYEQAAAYYFYKTLMKKGRNIYVCRTIAAHGLTDIKSIINRLGMDYYTVIAVRSGDITAEITEDRLRSFVEKKGINHNLVDILSDLSYYNR